MSAGKVNAGEREIALGEKNLHARRLFDGIARTYDRPAQVFSLFQYRYWHRFLASRLKLGPQDRVLDVATGPGGVAISIAEKFGCRVAGLDISSEMLEQARRNVEASGLASSISLVEGRAEDLPFPDGHFDAVVFTFLFRYVDDPQATVNELARVLKPGGQMASLEFYVPQGPVLHPLWLLHTRLVLPLGTLPLSPGWREVGSFLGPSISRFFRKYTLEDLAGMWRSAGLVDVDTRVLSAGGAFVMCGRKASDG